MISRYNHNGIAWVDLQSPTEEEIAQITKEFSIPEVAAEEFMAETLRSKVDVYDNFIYLILHFPTNLYKKTKSTEQEIDFVIGKNFLITIHYELIGSIQEFFKKFEHDSLTKIQIPSEHAGYLFYEIIKEFYKKNIEDLEKIHPEIRRIEKDIFDGKEHDTVRAISELNRKLLDFKQSMRFHSETLKSFESASKKFFGESFAFYVEKIIGEYNKITSVLNSYGDIIRDLRDTNDSLLSNKTNETVKILTIITFLISPATVIASIFMMNTSFSLIENIYEFYAVIGAMLLSSLVVFIFFKYKKWL